MDYRFMRIMVLFDLPTNTKKERSDATRFRNFLLNDGFDMLQYSIYTRICPNRDIANTHLKRVKSAAPRCGSIRLLMVTENQYTSMVVISGTKTPQEEIIKPKQLAFF